MSDPNNLEDYQGDFTFDESGFEPQPEESEVEESEVEEQELSESEESGVENDSYEEESTQPTAQTPDQNAYYAEQRRQNLVEQRVQQELQRLRQEAPEFQMAQMLSEMYGLPIDQMHEQLKEQRLQKEAEQRGVPVEIMKQLNAYEQQQAELQEQLNFMQFQTWQNRVEEEGRMMINQYPMLDANDIEQAKYFLLETLQNPEIPLQNAVFALHGNKIADSLRNLAKQEALAEISGRKKGGLPPQGTRATEGNSLSEEERYVARNMGLSESEYLKWKS